MAIAFSRLAQLVIIIETTLQLQANVKNVLVIVSNAFHPFNVNNVLMVFLFIHII
jgi:hypothetical protein